MNIIIYYKSPISLIVPFRSNTCKNIDKMYTPWSFINIYIRPLSSVQNNLQFILHELHDLS